MRAKSFFLSLTGCLNAPVATVLLLAGLAPGALAAQKQTPTAPSIPASVSATFVASTMWQDARLKRLISLHATNITLEDLLHKLSVNGLILAADHASEPRKLQIRLTRKPLSALMQSLAQLLPGNWRPRGDGNGYFFLMSLKAVERRERWWELFLQERERAEEAQRRFILQKMHAPPIHYKVYTDSIDPEHEDKEAEARDLRRQEFFSNLPPALQMRIANQMVDSSFYATFPSGGMDEGALVVPLPELPEQSRTLLLQESGEYYRTHLVDPASVLVRFSNFGYGVGVRLLLDKGIGTPLVTSDSHIGLNVDLCPDACVLSLNHQELVTIVKKLGNEAPAAWKELAAYQESRVWPNDTPRTSPSADFPPPGTYHADVLDWLADQAGIDIVADYYSFWSQPMSTTEKAHPLPANLKQELDVIARDQDLSWRCTSDSIYLFRNNRWYRDDKLEVPTTWLQRWRTQLEALQMPLSARRRGSHVFNPESDPAYLKARMDWQADVVSHLTDWQIATGFTWAAMERSVTAPATDQAAGSVAPATPHASAAPTEIMDPFLSAGMIMLKELGTARFYASLDEGQRAALRAGQLPPSALTPAQQEQVLYLAPILRYMAGRQPIWLGLHMQPQGVAYPANIHGVLHPLGVIGLAAMPAR